MALFSRQKLITIVLLFYWPTLFVFSHIPIPSVVRKAGVSDKCLHFMAYQILVFLLWCAISPDRKVNWRKATAWWVLLVTVMYGVIDELLQGVVVGRSCDVMDFFADFGGVITGLILLTFLTFWPAFLVVTGITIFAMTNVSRVNLADLLPVTYVLFLLFSHAFFSILWIQNMKLFLPFKAPKIKWLVVASALPTGFLGLVKLFSIVAARDFRQRDVMIAVVGIATVVITTYLAGLFRARRIQAAANT